MLFVPYQRGDSGMPMALSILQRSTAFIGLPSQLAEQWRPDKPGGSTTTSKSFAQNVTPQRGILSSYEQIR